MIDLTNPKIMIIVKEIESRGGKVRSNEIIDFFDSNSSVNEQNPGESNRWARQTVRNMIEKAEKLKKLERIVEARGNDPNWKVWFAIPSIRKKQEDKLKEWEEYIVDNIENLDYHINHIPKLYGLQSEEIGKIIDKIDLVLKLLLNITNSIDFASGGTKKWKGLFQRMMEQNELLEKEIEKTQKKYPDIRRHMGSARLDLLETSFLELDDLIKSSKI